MSFSITVNNFIFPKDRIGRGRYKGQFLREGEGVRGRRGEGAN